MLGTTVYNRDPVKRNVLVVNGGSTSYRKQMFLPLLQPFLNSIKDANIIWADNSVLDTYVKKHLVDKLGSQISATITKVKSKERFTSYQQLYQYTLEMELNLGEIDEVYIFGGNLYINVSRSEFLNEYFEKNAGFTFATLCRAAAFTFFGLAFAERFKLPLKHVIVDPDETDLSGFTRYSNCQRFFGYNSKIFNFKTNSYYLDQLKTEFVSNTSDKTYDLFIGYTILANHRKFIYNYRNIYDVENKKVAITDKYLNIYTTLPFNEYIKTLRQSKAQIIFPSYNRKSFSYMRFYETLFNGCLPLILDECFINEFIENDKERELLRPLIIGATTNIQQVIDNLHSNSYINVLQQYYQNK